MFITLDSSIIVAALRKQEEKHEQCILLLEKVKNAKHTAIQPYTVLVEVAAAIRRRTGSQILAVKIKEILQNIETIHFLELDAMRAESAVNIAVNTGLKGMDTIVVQVALEFNTTLVTLDDEIMEKAKSIVKIKSVDDFLIAI